MEQIKTKVALTLLMAMIFNLAGCGGNKILKEELPVDHSGPIGVNRDDSVVFALDLVVFRDGPGTWARNADWDEYRVRVDNAGNQAVTVTSVVVHDMMNLPISSGNNRKRLVRESKRIAALYENEGVSVVSGVGAGTFVAAGAVSAAVAVGTVAATGPIAIPAAAAGAAAVGLVAAPLLITGGVVRGVNGHKVSREIEERATRVPFDVAPGQAKEITAFFPLTVSPLAVELVYTEDGVTRSVRIDTRELLRGLHIGEAEPRKKRPYDETAWAHPRN